jgi:hypothetical protein
MGNLELVIGKGDPGSYLAEYLPYNKHNSYKYTRLY